MKNLHFECVYFLVVNNILLFKKTLGPKDFSNNVLSYDPAGKMMHASVALPIKEETILRFTGERE